MSATHTRRLLAGLLLSAVWPAAAAGQVAREAERPETVAAAFLRAISAARWAEAVGFLDLTGLETHRREMVQAGRIPQRELTVDDLRRREPEMPRAVAEYQITRWREARTRPSNYIEHEFAGVRDAAALGALAPEEAAARWLEAQDERYELRQQFTERGCSLPQGISADSLWTRPPNEVVGAVVRDSVAYVLHRDPRRDDDAGATAWFGTGPRIMHLRRTGGRWRILARYDLLRFPNLAISLQDCPTPAGPGRPG